MIDAPTPTQVVDVNYFVCTLGQAAVFNAEKPHAFRTVNELIDLQAQRHPSRPAVGFPIPPKDKNKDQDQEWEHAIYSK